MGEYLCQKTKVFLGGKQSFVGLSNVSLEFVINTNLSGFLFFFFQHLRETEVQAVFVNKKRNRVKHLFFISNC